MGRMGLILTAVGVGLIAVFWFAVWPPLTLAWLGAVTVAAGLLIDWEAFKHATARPSRRPK